MYFLHSDEVWHRFPQLIAAAIVVRGAVNARTEQLDTAATLQETCRFLDGTHESEIPSIQAWRRAYATMGLKPTQYRCAAEALLRRLRKDRTLPRFHSLVDLLNVESVKAAIPIAAFDIAHVVEGITVRPATGDEIYETFQGETEHPDPDEIIFADAAGQAHSRRWVFRQSAVSAVNDRSDSVLIVAEALHDDAEADLATLRSRLEHHTLALGMDVSESALLRRENRRFEFIAAN